MAVLLASLFVACDKQLEEHGLKGYGVVKGDSVVDNNDCVLSACAGDYMIHSDSVRGIVGIPWRCTIALEPIRKPFLHTIGSKYGRFRVGELGDSIDY